MTGSLETNVQERLAWLATVLSCVDPNVSPFVLNLACGIVLRDEL